MLLARDSRCRFPYEPASEKKTANNERYSGSSVVGMIILLCVDGSCGFVLDGARNLQVEPDDRREVLRITNECKNRLSIDHLEIRCQMIARGLLRKPNQEDWKPNTLLYPVSVWRTRNNQKVSHMDRN